MPGAEPRLVVVKLSDSFADSVMHLLTDARLRVEERAPGGVADDLAVAVACAAQPHRMVRGCGDAAALPPVGVPPPLVLVLRKSDRRPRLVRRRGHGSGQR